MNMIRMEMIYSGAQYLVSWIASTVIKKIAWIVNACSKLQK